MVNWWWYLRNAVFCTRQYHDNSFKKQTYKTFLTLNFLWKGLQKCQGSQTLPGESSWFPRYRFLVTIETRHWPIRLMTRQVLNIKNVDQVNQDTIKIFWMTIKMSLNSSPVKSNGKELTLESELFWTMFLRTCNPIAWTCNKIITASYFHGQCWLLFIITTNSHTCTLASIITSCMHLTQLMEVATFLELFFSGQSSILYAMSAKDSICSRQKTSFAYRSLRILDFLFSRRCITSMQSLAKSLVKFWQAPIILCKSWTTSSPGIDISAQRTYASFTNKQQQIIVKSERHSKLQQKGKEA